jgi:lysozyme
VVPPNWPTWMMWQYTDGGIGPEPHTVNGIGRCDRDKFNGNENQLRKLWGAAEPANGGGRYAGPRSARMAAA